MKSFHFRLESVLRYKKTIAAGEEAKLAVLKAALDRARAALETLRLAQQAVEAQMLHAGFITGSDLRSLSAYQIDMKHKTVAANNMIKEAETAFLTQLQRVRQARQECRLLEKLRRKRLDEWTLACDKEIEELAASSFLAQWTR